MVLKVSAEALASSSESICLRSSHICAVVHWICRIFVDVVNAVLSSVSPSGFVLMEVLPIGSASGMKTKMLHGSNFRTFNTLVSKEFIQGAGKTMIENGL